MFSNLDTEGLLLILAGLVIRFIVGRRRFSRRNFTGVQVFSSYIASQLVPLLERLFNLLGMLLILIGLFSPLA